MNTKDLQQLLDTASAEDLKGNYAETERMAQQVLRELDAKTQPTEHSAEATALLVLRAEATRLLSSVAWRRGENSSALEYSHEALSLAESSGDTTMQAKVMNSIGSVYTSLSDYPKALEYYARALSQYKEVGDKAGVARVTANVGSVYDSQSDYAKALEYNARALSQYEEVGDKAGVARVTANVGSVYDSLSDYPKALEYFARALSQHEEIGNKAGVALVTGNIGNVYLSLSDYAKALEYYARALSQYEEVGNKAGVADVTGNIGLVYNTLSDYAKALEYYARALSQHEERGDKAGVARVTGNIGNVYNALSDYPKALEYYARALSQHEEVGNKASVALVTGNIGIVYAALSDYPKSLEYYARALSQYEEVGNKAGVALVTGNIGLVYTSLSDYAKALEFLSRGLRWQEELGQRSEAAYTKASLGVLFANEANPERDEAKAEGYLRESIATSEELGTKNYKAHKILAELYERQERWQDFAFHLKKYHELKDEVQSEEASKTAVQMEQRRLIAEREKEIAVAKAAADAQMSATTTLLYKVLPQTIATRLIKGEKVADYFRDVSVLFADIVGFTPIVSRMPARAVLAFLNYVFGEFDRIMERNGCEKIKTMGDGYLAVAGAPLECSDHAERITRAALEMMGDIILPDEIRKTIPKGAEFSIRIGIHMGPCFAGIVGENRFVYDIYSDAVNIAARMESHGEAGKIHVSDEFCFHLQNRMEATGENFGGIRFDEREEMEIKGKGMMRTYFLERA